ncbi:MAG: aromatic ring-hydroxylating dioxygenase subunit alpha [Lacisediminimonas sp.]|nr:aromatic ring-hydroxylating dioxygenase subunit alpha [Lacisediminimonas sp.]
MMAKIPIQPYSGYLNPRSNDDDPALTHVGAGTPGGEYLRRFWHPIAMVAELKDMPMPIRVLGEDLILFRDKSGRVGLVHKHCSHRGTSLEYGIIGERGIRCAYHGWAYDVDGTVLDTPSEPAGSRLKETVCQGAYRTHESHGLIFTYMGPPDQVPEFPVYDTTVWPDDTELVPLKLDLPCNWLQAHENAADPIHTAYLHSIVTGVQFTPSFAALPVLEFAETPLGLLAIATRRCGDNLWIRASDVILPNMAQFGTGFVDGEKEKFALTAAFTRWITPVDDTHCWYIGWRQFNPVIDPRNEGRKENIGRNRIDLMGQTDERPYLERQKSPGDWDAIVAQGPIVKRTHEHLSWTDKGVAMLRRQLRAGIREVQSGLVPAAPRNYGKGIVPTYNNETILSVPQKDGDDKSLLQSFGHKVCKVAIESAHLPVGERQRHVERAVRAMQASGEFYDGLSQAPGQQQEDANA